jgi:hypothetical protein
VQAVEGAFGRSLTGQQITPFVGIVPPDPGFIWSLGYVHYSGDIGASRQAPIGGQLAVNLDATFDLPNLTAVYIWPSPKGRWNYASALVLPFAWADVSADSVIGSASFDTADDNSGLFDLTFAPLIASYHVSEMEHWSFALYVAAPTGDYDPGRLANVSLNNWTFSPAIGYTKLFMKGGLEVSLQSAVDFFTKNDATNYQNGEVFRAEGLVMMRLPSGFGFGAIAGWLEQISDDDSPTLPDSLDGFRQHVLGAGPAFTYSHHLADKSSLDVNFRWIFEIDAENSFEGSGGQLTIGWHH